MRSKNEQPKTSLRPYDESMWERYHIYDNMPYTWDSDFEKHLKSVSGNIIKGYRYQIKEPYEIKH